MVRNTNKGIYKTIQNTKQTHSSAHGPLIESDDIKLAAEHRKHHERCSYVRIGDKSGVIGENEDGSVKVPFKK